MDEKIINPHRNIYPATPDYVHGLVVRNVDALMFVSGTMGLDTSGTPPKSLDAQLVLIWDNLRCILAEAGMTMENVVRITSYLRDSDYALKNQEARVQALQDRRVPTTTIVAQTLAIGWLIEIELIAV